MLLPKWLVLRRWAMRVPNWIARFRKKGAAESPSSAATARTKTAVLPTTRLDTSPKHAVLRFAEFFLDSLHRLRAPLRISQYARIQCGPREQ